MTAALDPLLIFGLGLGVDGAAIATVVSRLIFVFVGYRGAVGVHGSWRGRASTPCSPTRRRSSPSPCRPCSPTSRRRSPSGFLAERARPLRRRGDRRASPSSTGWCRWPSAGSSPCRARSARSSARTGAPAASTACGVILRDGMRVHGALRRRRLGAARAAPGPACRRLQAERRRRDLVAFFCLVSGAIWFFIGLLFVANAAFNNLGFPLLSTAFNWGRATLGTMPLALGARLRSGRGVLAAVGIGSIVFGTAGARDRLPDGRHP